MNIDLPHIGRAERIDIVDYGFKAIPAKIDTGADSSSVWASSIMRNDEGLTFSLFNRGSKYYTGDTIHVPTGQFAITRIANSFGHRELRYKVTLKIRVHDQEVHATFTLADRSKKLYPILLGRSFLEGRFLVNVSAGDPLIAEEKARNKRLQQIIDAHEQNIEE